MSEKIRRQFEDILSLIVLRIFAKRKKGMISDSDFNMIASFGAQQAIGVITVASSRKSLAEMMDEEIRKAVELMSQKSCGKCKGRGVSGRNGARYIVCGCVDMVHYRGDSVLPIGEQYSNDYFTGEFSKTELGRKDMVENISAAVMLFLMPK